jgi:hypothetical protein
VLRIALVTFAIWVSLSFLVLLMVARVATRTHVPRSTLRSRDTHS